MLRKNKGRPNGLVFCVYSKSTTSDYERVFCRGCILYIENMAHFEGEDLDDELVKYGDDADVFIILFKGAGHTRFNITTAKLSFKTIELIIKL